MHIRPITARAAAVILSRPEPGLWVLRAVKHGPLVPARIHWTACPDCAAQLDPTVLANVSERSPTLIAEMAGEPVPVDRIWLSRKQPIDEAEYRYRLATAAWAREHDPQSPEANPGRPVLIESVRTF